MYVGSLMHCSKRTRFAFHAPAICGKTTPPPAGRWDQTTTHHHNQTRNCHTVQSDVHASLLYQEIHMRHAAPSSRLSIRTWTANLIQAVVSCTVEGKSYLHTNTSRSSRPLFSQVPTPHTSLALRYIKTSLNSERDVG